MSDLMDIYLKGCSSLISSLIYDIDKRILVLECINNPDDCIPRTRVTFSGIRSYSEETVGDGNDDRCMDIVIGMHWIKANVFCLHTDKKEIIIEIENEPKAEIIA